MMLKVCVTALIFMFICAGCQSTEKPKHDAAKDNRPSAASTPAPASTFDTTTQSFSNRLIQREVLLHAALYRVAYQSNVAGPVGYFLLEPVDESDPPELGTNASEFRLCVIAQLANLGVPVAWVPETWRRGDDFYPGTTQLATRLRIKILHRNEDQATVTAEVGDTTAGVGSSRQGVTATWDGANWSIDRDQARVVW